MFLAGLALAEHSPGSLLHCLHISFHKPITLATVRGTEPNLNSFLSEEGQKFSGVILRSIIGPEHLYSVACLIRDEIHSPDYIVHRLIFCFLGDELSEV